MQKNLFLLLKKLKNTECPSLKILHVLAYFNESLCLTCNKYSLNCESDEEPSKEDLPIKVGIIRYILCKCMFKL